MFTSNFNRLDICIKMFTPSEGNSHVTVQTPITGLRMNIRNHQAGE
jgi:hypothetical protein